MSWINNVRVELARAIDAEKTGNAGRARTSARRAVGIALTELQQPKRGKVHSEDFVRQLRRFAEDFSLPDDVRSAAGRLQSRVATDFTSPSSEPIADAAIIIDFIRRSCCDAQRLSSAGKS